jgi:hypothetical protein
MNPSRNEKLGIILHHDSAFPASDSRPTLWAPGYPELHWQVEKNSTSQNHNRPSGGMCDFPMVQSDVMFIALYNY